jgi:hypothetical protein
MTDVRMHGFCFRGFCVCRLCPGVLRHCQRCSQLRPWPAHGLQYACPGDTTVHRRVRAEGLRDVGGRGDCQRGAGAVWWHGACDELPHCCHQVVVDRALQRCTPLLVAVKVLLAMLSNVAAPSSLLSPILHHCVLTLPMLLHLLSPSPRHCRAPSCHL